MKNLIIVISGLAYFAVAGKLCADPSAVKTITEKCVKYISQVPNCKCRYVVHCEDNLYREFSKFNDKFYIKEFTSDKYDQLLQSVSFDGKNYYHLTTQGSEKYLVVGSNVSIAAWAFRSYLVSNPFYEPFSFFMPNYEGFSLPLIALPESWLRASSDGMMPVDTILNQGDQRDELVFKYRKDEANNYLIKFRVSEELPYRVSGIYRNHSFIWTMNGIETKRLKNGKQFNFPKSSEYVAKDAQNLVIPKMSRSIKIDSESFEEILDEPGPSIYRVGVDVANEIYDADLKALIKTRKD